MCGTGAGDTFESLWRDGFMLIRSVLSAPEAVEIAADLATTLEASAGARGVRRSRGRVYAARNLGRLWAGVRPIERLARLNTPLEDVLGAAARLVRVIYFDKPPGRSWSLPWHRDTMLAVADTSRPASGVDVFTRAGVPHISGGVGVLSQMLTVRLHLDPATEENGALLVVPGSHRTPTSAPDDNVRVIATACGDALLMRPLLLHKSNDAQPGSPHHRRILHLEFAAAEAPAPGFAWADPYSGP